MKTSFGNDFLFFEKVKNCVFYKKVSISPLFEIPSKSSKNIKSPDFHAIIQIIWFETNTEIWKMIPISMIFINDYNI